MREHQHLAGGQVLPDVSVVHLRLVLIGDEDHDDVGPLGRIGDRHDSEAGSPCLLNRLAGGRQADDDVHTSVLQVERMRVPLRAISDDRHFPIADQLDVRVLVVKHRRHLYLLLFA